MLGRILLVILPLLFVFVASEENDDRECLCEMYWARKVDPGPKTVTFRIDLFEIISPSFKNDKYDDCETFSGKCLQKCEDHIRGLYDAISLPTDRRFKLGKMLCEQIGVGISRFAPRHIFLKTKIDGCEVFDNVEMGDLCCYSCVNSGTWEVSYNPGCSSTNFPIGDCDI
ncbi:hypothetical protein HOLleu_26966 [Holothuria leucospilota]|uniref:Uncharacterized protein n=1 Tax=Holothuria leucospilota TaxID=206669 RepID=A0A9Q1BPX6_HOLLE|nr:hypothetical protein HOLleu_26966 [Holothuria leucospilota]